MGSLTARAHRAPRSRDRAAGLRRALLTLGVLLAASCDDKGELARSRRADPAPLARDPNTGPVQRYHEAIVAHSGAKVVTEGCDMFAGTRVGRCLVRGEPGQVAALVGSLPLDGRGTGPAASPPSGPSCAELPAFGGPQDPALPTLRQLRPGVRFLWRRASGVPAGFPRNQANVVLRAAYLDPAAGHACVEYEYPYG